MNLTETATAGARELNKSIDQIAVNLLVGLTIIATAIYLKK